MKSGTFLVVEADDDTAVLRDVEDGQVHTLGGSEHELEGLEPGEVLDASLRAEPPLAVVWHVEDIEGRYAVSIRESEEPPTRQVEDTAADQAIGDVTIHDRAGTGEVHVLTVPDEATQATVASITDDDATLERAARLGVEHVEIRAGEGVVSVRYLP